MHTEASLPRQIQTKNARDAKFQSAACVYASFDFKRRDTLKLCQEALQKLQNNKLVANTTYPNGNFNRTTVKEMMLKTKMVNSTASGGSGPLLPMHSICIYLTEWFFEPAPHYTTAHMFKMSIYAMLSASIIHIVRCRERQH